MCLHRNPNHLQIPAGLRLMGSVWFTEDNRASYRMGDLTPEQLRFLADLEQQFRNETPPASAQLPKVQDHSSSGAFSDIKG